MKEAVKLQNHTAALLLAATALAVATLAGGYLFLRSQYSTDLSLVEAHISEVARQRGFDMVGARNSGYTDAEIAAFLVKRDEADFSDIWKTLWIAVGSIYVVCALGIFASRASRKSSEEAGP